jgi:hypothetical protein
VSTCHEWMMLYNAKWAIFQLYRGGEKNITFDEIVDILTHNHDSDLNKFFSFSLMLSACNEATNTNFIVFGLTWPGLKLMIYHTGYKHANHYTTCMVQ